MQYICRLSLITLPPVCFHKEARFRGVGSETRILLEYPYGRSIGKEMTAILVARDGNTPVLLPNHHAVQLLYLTQASLHVAIYRCLTEVPTN